MRLRPTTFTASFTGLTLAGLMSLPLGCSSTPVAPTAKAMTISRDNPPSNCEDLGLVQGSVPTVNGTVEQAIEAMKLDAAQKGANTIRMEATSALGTTVRGTAFRCP